MSLTPGTSLGPYQIVAPIGQGGMGEVYQAIDTRLDRTVAIKVLPAELAADPDPSTGSGLSRARRDERRERFEREAKAIAALNHPHICTLHDVGHEVPSTGSGQVVDFFVMEYLEGESLQERLKKGALPLDQALEMAIQIADALDKAHRQGITHRDLKPGNIFLVGSGAARRSSPQAARRNSSQAKLLDFGLAKLADARSARRLQPSDHDSTKLADSLTAQGTILGTSHYMAPEQLEGREADARSDIWALGCVLYEMLTGRKAFEGATQASVSGAILEREPAPITDLQPLTPHPLDRTLSKCLAKDPERRWQSAGDLTDTLRWVSEPAPADEAAVVAVPQPASSRVVWLAVAFLVGAAAAGLAMLVLGPGPTDVSSPPLTHAVVSLPPHQQFFGSVTNAPPVAVSADGRQIAYTVSEGTTTRLYLQRLDEFGARAVPQSAGANNPFFSPDGQWVGFFGPDGLYKAATTGGSAIRLGDGPAIGAGAHWTDEDTILFSDLSSLYRMSAEGGSAELLVTLEGDSNMFAPHALPGGQRVLIKEALPGQEQRISVLSLKTRELTPIPGLEGAMSATYLPSGHLVFNRGSDIWAAVFDPETLRLVGEPVALIENVEFQNNTGTAFVAIGAGGTLAYAPRGPLDRLVWVDREGRVSPLSVEPGRYRLPRLDPSGTRIVVAEFVTNRMSELRLIDIERGSTTRLILGDYPVWSPDGESVTASLIGGARLSLTQVPIGNPSSTTTLEATARPVPGDWSADGRLHVFYDISTGSNTNRDLWVIARDGEAEPFLVTPANERTPYFSPDARWIVYVSDESGRDEVYVQAYPEGYRRWAISTDGGREPIWSADGSEVFYRSGQQMLAVDVSQGERFEAGIPRVLFEARMGVDVTGLPSYDVTSDGSRFLMLTDSSPRELRIIEDFGRLIVERLAGEG